MADVGPDLNEITEKLHFGYVHVPYDSQSSAFKRTMPRTKAPLKRSGTESAKFVVLSDSHAGGYKFFRDSLEITNELFVRDVPVKRFEFVTSAHVRSFS